MSTTLVLLLATSLAHAGPANLNFATGKLTGWEGEGFEVVTHGGTRVASSARKGKALLHRTFHLPANAVSLNFSAAVVRPTGTNAGESIDVVLEGASRYYFPREVRSRDNWVQTAAISVSPEGKLREYRFPVESHAGKRARIALMDSDDREGCYLLAGGFSITTRDEVNGRQFAEDMRKLQREHNLPKMLRYDSKHFVALSNADAGDSEYRLHNCETIHSLFFDHFRKRGFAVKPPADKMMVVIFSTPQGFEAYMGQKMSEAITGVYHTPSNRLVVYDYGKNKYFLEGKKSYEDAAKRGTTDLEREQRTIVFGRHVRDRRNDTNISTIMHEVAHQLSFNCGMVNRTGDVPVWLAEGLAVYCESTVKGAWQGIGEPNPPRLNVLASQLKGNGELYPLRTLIENDDWIRKAKTVEPVVLGYSQSWALFRMLMEQRPKQLRAYLETIYPRRTPEHRLTDFASAFGADLGKLDKQYQAYVREMVRKEDNKSR